MAHGIVRATQQPEPVDDRPSLRELHDQLCEAAGTKRYHELAQEFSARVNEVVVVPDEELDFETLDLSKLDDGFARPGANIIEGDEEERREMDREETAFEGLFR